ncbi:MAG TPA: acyltransferase [Pyrinomonadaceae bacterium]|nr:acyltransferase [Pyrinomonadaceae bacterium]
MKKIYFPNLNGLRFIAALLVIIHHLEQFKSVFGKENYFELPSIRMIGDLGVVLFFVLSGFLITYLLLEEQKATETISIKDFYIRRILRIWGLYYLIVILGLFVFPNIEFLNTPAIFEGAKENLLPKTLLFVFFLPNLAFWLYPPVPFASQTWSIGVEEQFYLIQPLIVKKFKNLPVILIVIGSVYFIVKMVMSKLGSVYPDHNLFFFNMFWQTLNFDCFAIGGLAAVALFKKNFILDFIFTKTVQILTILATIVLIAMGIHIKYFHQEFFSLLFAIIILNLAANRNNLLKLENPILNYLGKISYGLYMYHPIVIFCTIKLLILFGLYNNILLFILALLVTILISSLSYHLFEHKLIMQKNNFSKLITGD